MLLVGGTMLESEVLQYAIDNGIIDTTLIQEQIRMKKNNELLQKHPYKIWEGKDGKWHSYLPDKQKGRIPRKRNTREELEEIIIDYWKKQQDSPTIREVFDEWNTRRLDLNKISRATFTRNQQIFDRHFKDFGNRRIRNVSPSDISDFLEKQIPENNLSAKGFSNLKGITKGLLMRAKRKGYIDFSVREMFDDLDISEVQFTKHIKEDEEEVFNEIETARIIKYLTENMDILNASILLMFVTGIRCGEVAALKREDFTDVSVKIRRTETRYKSETGYKYEIKDFPKTKAGVREIAIPSDFQWVIKFLLENGGEDFVVSGKKRYPTYTIRRRLYRICNLLNIQKRSPHKIRKTYASILLDNNIDERFVISQMGHTSIECTEKFYHRNRRDIEEKVELLSAVPDFKAPQWYQKNVQRYQKVSR